MNPQIARTIAAQHRDGLALLAAASRRGTGRRPPRRTASWLSRARRPASHVAVTFAGF